MPKIDSLEPVYQYGINQAYTTINDLPIRQLNHDIFDRYEFNTYNQQDVSLQEFLKLSDDELLKLSDEQIVKILDEGSYQLLVKKFYEKGGTKISSKEGVATREHRLRNLNVMQEILTDVRHDEKGKGTQNDLLVRKNLFQSALETSPYLGQGYKLLEDFFTGNVKRYFMNQIYDTISPRIKDPIQRFIKGEVHIIPRNRILNLPITTQERDQMLSEQYIGTGPHVLIDPNITASPYMVYDPYVTAVPQVISES